MIRFANPEVLLFLFLLPLLLFLKGKQGNSPSILYSYIEIMKFVSKKRKSKPGRLLFILRLVCLSFLIIALARPQFGRSTSEIEASGIDILLAVDVSGSMEALDFKIGDKHINRLEVVKSVVSKFILQRPNDRIGLIGFAGKPYVVSPLTLDHDWLEKRLEVTKIGMSEDGTAIGSAIAAGVNRLKDQKAKSKIMILLTDGMNNAGKISPLTSAEVAKTLGIKIYTIGAGSHGEVPIPARDRFGGTRLVMAKVDIDEETLSKVADITGGQYYRATDTDSLERIYDEINKMEATTRKVKKFEHYNELFYWFAGIGLIILAIEILLANTRYRRLP
ncbi:MAG: VWA domain-containing protein [Desulfobacterales bacterium]|nr:VWA domain-containing protein [Desulfobacterales bacterium]